MRHGIYLNYVQADQIEKLFYALPARSIRYLEFVADRDEQFLGVHLRICDKGHLHIRRHLIEEKTAEGGFTATDLPCEQNKAPVIVDTVHEVSHRLPVPFAHIKIARISSQRKRLLLQIEMPTIGFGCHTPFKVLAPCSLLSRR